MQRENNVFPVEDQTAAHLKSLTNDLLTNSGDTENLVEGVVVATSMECMNHGHPMFTNKQKNGFRDNEL